MEGYRVRKILPFVASLFLFVLTASPFIGVSRAQETNPEDSSEVYAFLPSFVLDTKRSTFLNRVSSKTYPLMICSDNDSFCIKSSEFFVVMPKNCIAREAFLNGGGSPSSKVLTSFVRKRHVLEERLFLLFNAAHPSYGIVVGDNGIVGIIYNPAKPIDTVVTSEAMAGAMQGKSVPFLHAELASMVPLGRCRR